MPKIRVKPEHQAADQLERFKETARALGCDEDEAAFDEKLKAIARQRGKPAGHAAPDEPPPSSAPKAKG